MAGTHTEHPELPCPTSRAPRLLRAVLFLGTSDNGIKGVKNGFGHILVTHGIAYHNGSLLTVTAGSLFSASAYMS